MTKRNWFVSMLSLFFGLIVLVSIIFGVGWVQFNKVNGRTFVKGQPVFYSIFDRKFVIRAAKENVTGVSNEVGAGPESASYTFSGIVSDYDPATGIVGLVGVNTKIRLHITDQSVFSVFESNRMAPMVTKDPLLLTVALTSGRMVLVTFNEKFEVVNYVLSVDK